MGTAALVNRHTEGGGIGLEHGLDAIGQEIGVLVHVRGGDGKQHLVVRERVDVVLAGAFIARRRLGQPPVPGRDGTGIIAGPGRAEGRQVFAEMGRLRGRDRRQAGRGNDRQRQDATKQHVLVISHGLP